jgi:phosphoserine aminotransferase
MSHKVYNFSAGPANLPSTVLKKVQSELLDWSDSGMSVMEVSHRSKDFVALAVNSESMLRELLNVPSNYKILFLQGGATGQFSAIPLNISTPTDTADYIITGNWGKKASEEARSYLNVNVVANESTSNYTTLPDLNKVSFSSDAAYVHYTPNETVYGVEFSKPLAKSSVPMVADMSSTILSRPIDIGSYDLIYAGAQKNIGPAGLTIVVINENLLGKARSITPSVLNYTLMSESESMYNTPPTLSWYIATLVFRWLLDTGGLEERHKINLAKANLLYQCIDSSKIFKAPVVESARSLMNIVFTAQDNELEKTFLEEASKANLKNLKGHRMIGGMRASIYNAMPIEGVETLVDFIDNFDRRYT